MNRAGEGITMENERIQNKNKHWSRVMLNYRTVDDAAAAALNYPHLSVHLSATTEKQVMDFKIGKFRIIFRVLNEKLCVHIFSTSGSQNPRYIEKMLTAKQRHLECGHFDVRIRHYRGSSSPKARRILLTRTHHLQLTASLLKCIVCVRCTMF